MQRFFSAIGHIFGKSILTFCLVSLLSLSGLFIFTNQSALAVSNKPLNPPSPEAIDRAYTMSEAAGLKEEDRQAAYEEATEAINESNGIEKIYEEDLEEYQEETSGGNGLLEGAKDLVDKVTGKE